MAIGRVAHKFVPSRGPNLIFCSARHNSMSCVPGASPAYRGHVVCAKHEPQPKPPTINSRVPQGNDLALFQHPHCLSSCSRTIPPREIATKSPPNPTPNIDEPRLAYANQTSHVTSPPLRCTSTPGRRSDDLTRLACSQVFGCMPVADFASLFVLQFIDLLHFFIYRVWIAKTR
jgi:hypothetical protein